MAGYIGSKTVNLSTTGADIAGDADVSGALDVGGAFTSQGIDDNATSTAMTLDASGSIGIGTSSPDRPLHVTRGDGTGTVVKVGNTGSSAATIEFANTGSTDTVSIGAESNDLVLKSDDGDISLNTTGDPATASLYIERGGNVGIGVTDPDSAIEVQSSASGINSAHLSNTNSTGYGVKFVGGGNTSTRYIADFRDYSGASKVRLDGSGNLLVGKTVTSTDTTGITLNSNGAGWFTGDGIRPLLINRKTSDGDMLEFRKDGSTVGSIASQNGNGIFIGSGTSGGGAVSFYSSDPNVFPARNSGGSLVLADNQIDFGSIYWRYNDAYITNGVTTGSDGNDKQDIRDLTEAEQRVAVACKGLLKAWRWKSAVEEKGDNARIHCGIIAQDLQAAFAAEGLDAGRYAMFMSNTWWETQTEVPAVEAVAEVLDEEGNVVTEAVEAVDAYTRTDTYETQEEAPEGATERTRLGVRYSELLAFIIGAL